MQRKKLVAGNWKMNLSPTAAEKFVNEIKGSIDTDDVDVVMCVPAVYISMVQKLLEGTKIKVGAQNMHYAEKGAYTGEISGEMLSGMGVPYVILGHSERREYFAETDISVNLRALQALKHGITPIICIGETLKQRESNRTANVVRKQLTVATIDMTEEDLTKIVIAYEPIWAIGTGKTATAEQAEEVCAAIRKQIKDRHGNWAADSVRVLYGGSVNANNANVIFNMENIDGGLVGGASLDPGFEKVVKYGG
jgi:triosephosphate isomerase